MYFEAKFDSYNDSIFYTGLNLQLQSLILKCLGQQQKFDSLCLSKKTKLVPQYHQSVSSGMPVVPATILMSVFGTGIIFFL